MATSQVRVDKRALAQILHEADGRQDDLLDALALEGERIVKMSFGTSRGSGRVYHGKIIRVTSAPGDPPDVQTGKLLNSIYVRTPKRGQRVIGTDVDYAPHLEFGTSKMAARPFMRPMLEELRGKVDAIARSVNVAGGSV